MSEPNEFISENQEIEEYNIEGLDENAQDNSSELTHSTEDETSWIYWFINLKGNDFFCEVDEEYFQDDFNLTGLSQMVPFYDYALDMILDVDIPADHLTDDQMEVVETAAEVLYGLVHARYILTNRGMQRMYEKYNDLHFGRCPRVFCQGQGVLPVGLSDLPRTYSINLFCPRCHDIFYPKSVKQANLDGAYFGTTFSHLFLLMHPDQIPPKVSTSYIPRIYGFRIHATSHYWKHAISGSNKSNSGNNNNNNNNSNSNSNNRKSNGIEDANKKMVDNTKPAV